MAYEWWKPTAAILVPIAIAVAPVTLSWMSSDRGVDNVIVASAFSILAADPDDSQEEAVRDWAMDVIEGYTNQQFSAEARREIQESPLEVEQLSIFRTLMSATGGDLAPTIASIGAAQRVPVQNWEGYSPSMIQPEGGWETDTYYQVVPADPDTTPDAFTVVPGFQNWQFIPAE